jgi:hypothetical protein
MFGAIDIATVVCLSLMTGSSPPPRRIPAGSKTTCAGIAYTGFESSYRSSYCSARWLASLFSRLVTKRWHSKTFLLRMRLSGSEFHGCGIMHTEV